MFLENFLGPEKTDVVDLESILAVACQQQCDTNEDKHHQSAAEISHQSATTYPNTNADTDANNGSTTNANADVGTDSTTKRQRWSTGKPRIPKEYKVQFKGNDSTQWDGKTISVDSDWMEELHGSDIWPGQIVELPWGDKHWRTMIVEVPGTTLEEKPGQPVQPNSNVKKILSRKPNAKKLTTKKSTAKKPQKVPSPKEKVDKQVDIKGKVPKRAKRGDSKGTILHVGRLTEKADGADDLEQPRDLRKVDNVETLFSQLVAQQEKIIDILSLLATHSRTNSPSPPQAPQPPPHLLPPPPPPPPSPPPPPPALTPPKPQSTASLQFSSPQQYDTSVPPISPQLHSKSPMPPQQHPIMPQSFPVSHSLSQGPSQHQQSPTQFLGRAFSQHKRVPASSLPHVYTSTQYGPSTSFSEKNHPSGYSYLVEEDSENEGSLLHDYNVSPFEDSDYWSTDHFDVPLNRSSPGATPHLSPSASIPPVPFPTPPKLKSVEQVLNENSGTDVNALRRLTTALAREAIFGKDELAKNSLSGRQGTGELDKVKVNYIKTLVHSRVPKQSKVDFENIWKMCRGSLSKSCQTMCQKRK